MTWSLNLSLTHVLFVGMTLAVNVVSVSCVDEKIGTVAKTLQTCRLNTLFGAGTSAVSLNYECCGVFGKHCWYLHRVN
ncbi:hypothetical protein EDD85DRAFT_832676, partial [Armillaria nabsnona]